MKTIRVKNQQELNALNVGKLYNIRDHSGRELFLTDQDGYAKLTAQKTIFADTCCFCYPQSGVILKTLKKEYGIEIIFTDEANIEEMAKKSLIAVIKDYCYKVGKIEDNLDDIYLHYIDIKEKNLVWLPDYKWKRVKISKVAYDAYGEDDNHSGVLVWLEKINEQYPNNVMGVFVAENFSYQTLSKIIELLKETKK